jgi:2-phosphoglycerate kinase
MKITKKNGRVVVYDDEKVIKSILKASIDAVTEEISRKKAQVIADEVFQRLTREKDIISTDDVRTCTAAILREKGYPKTAACYEGFKR